MPEQPQGCSLLSSLTCSTTSHAHADTVLRGIPYCSFHSGVREDLFAGCSPGKTVRPQRSPFDFQCRPAPQVGGATAFALPTTITIILRSHSMKRVKTIQSFPLRSSLLLAALAMASVSAQASVTITTGNHDLGVIRDAGAIEIRDAGSIELVSGGNVSIQQPILITPPATSLGNAAASSQVSGNMNYSVGSSYGSYSESDYSADGSSVALVLSRKGFGYQAEAAATGTQLKARAQTQWTQTTDSNGYSTGYGSSSAQATSNWSDWFVISGGTGLGTASFMAQLNGNLQSTANGSASFGLTVGYSTNTYCYYWYNTCSTADQSQTLISQTTSLSGKSKTTLTQSVEGEFTFAYDTPFQLTATLNAGASNGGLADVNFDTLSHSLVLPQGVSLHSASGLYVQAVPEAETYAMMLSGLALLGYKAKRRKLVMQAAG
jgi:hypothetical protein